MLQKQPINIPFAQGVDTKTDPFQVKLGKLLSLSNAVFNKGGQLQKRNGYASITSLPDATSKQLTTYNNNLLAFGGNNLCAYSQGSASWVTKGSIPPCALSVSSLVKNNTNQSQADSFVASNGIVCVAYTDQSPASLSTPVYKYVIADSSTGQNIISPTVIVPSSGTIVTPPKVFGIGDYFAILFVTNIGGNYHLQYIAIAQDNPTSTVAATDVSTVVNTTNAAFEGVVANNNLYISYNASDGGGAVRFTRLNHILQQSNTVVFATYIATIISVTADVTGVTEKVYVSFYNSGTSLGYTFVIDNMMSTTLAPTAIIAAITVVNIATSAQSGVCTIAYETTNAYSYDGAIPSNFISKKTITVSGTVSAASVVVRSVGLASKQFLYNSVAYALVAYQSAYQNTYFLINITTSTAANPVIVAKLAYSNGGGYLTKGLPFVSLNSNVAQIPYLFKDFLTSVNKGTNLPSGTQTAGIFSQTGINLANFNLAPTKSSVAETGGDLQLNGGMLWMYDGFLPVENNFFLFPDSIEATWSAAGGSIVAKPDGATNTNAYFYQVTYEWSDNVGNIFKSSPSIPISVTTTGAGSSGSITVNVPNLRLTYKTNNPVKIVIYRWSVAQQTYYQVTSLTTPVVNSLTTDSVAYVDTLADATILGNSILYTTGGVVENLAPPATNIMTLFDNRLWLLDAEDTNLLWYSKQIIEATPVEMSDLFTFFVPSASAAQGATGPITALGVMDDKLIVFKKNAMFYINGSGPDNTGANGQYSQPILINSTIGCTNQNSIVFMPQGIMFQSDKGIWLLGRDLSTSYIGAEVEDFNAANVLSAVNVPATNQVRFVLDSNVTLMYDYYYSQWGTFIGVPAVSSTIYQNLHTFINSLGKAFQEQVGFYQDGAQPVLMSLQTNWLNFSGLQGLERIYEMYLLGTYITPHFLSVQIYYDYNSSALQSNKITPDNFAGTWGSTTLWGDASPWGGPGNIEQWRIFMQKQKCQSMSIVINELFDPSFSTTPGAGLILHGIDLTVGIKSSKPTISASRQVG